MVFNNGQNLTKTYKKHKSTDSRNVAKSKEDNKEKGEPWPGILLTSSGFSIWVN